MVKSCELLYADGDKYVWSVVSENEESFPISASITAVNSVWNNSGVKKVLGANGWVQEDPLPISENGNYAVKDIDAVAVDVEGGGATFPVFTVDGGTWSCSITYAEAKAVLTENEDARHTAPCLTDNLWITYSLSDGEAFQQAKSNFSNVPDDMTEGLIIMAGVPLLFGSDGNFYSRNAN